MKDLNEGAIKDIMDMAREIKDTEIESLFKGMRNGGGTGSINSKAEKLIMVFPVICSKMMDINTASMVAKAIERKSATMLNLLFTSTQFHHTDDFYDYLSQFHTNINLKNTTVDGMKDILDIAFKESTAHDGVDNIIFEKKQMEILNRDIKNLDSYLEDNVSESAITSFKFIPSNRYGKSSVIQEAPSDVEKEFETMIKYNKDYRDAKSDYRADRKEERDSIKDGRDREKHNWDRFNHGANKRREERDIESHEDKLKSNMIKSANDQKSFFTSNNLLDNDIKKANELVPTTMVVKYFAKPKGVNEVIPVTIIAGVKAKIYSVDSLDIMERLSSQGKNANAFNKFVRATTREISFVRDFLLAIDQAKIDALSQSRKGSSSKLWKILERRGTKSKIKRRFGMNNDASPISTLVITQEEVEYMKKEYNVNLEDFKIVRNILDTYNFMHFVIVDQVNESIKFLADTGDDVFEELSFNNLEREAVDGSYKKMVNLMTKVTK